MAGIYISFSKKQNSPVDLHISLQKFINENQSWGQYKIYIMELYTSVLENSEQKIVTPCMY